nr:diguanylate cyclase [uncultured Albidiferax sp.]
MPIPEDQISSPTILVVDDDSTVILSLRKMLAAFGDSLFATSGRQALSIACAETPDLILLDVEMPGMDGLEVCRALKAKPETADIPVLFITSHTETGFEEKVFAAGAADYISKPLNPPVVIARVRTHLAYRNALANLSALANKDRLTGLHNRRSFDARIDLDWRRAKRQLLPLSMLMIDIDEFKKYNDAFGHVQGDVCLQSVAAFLGANAHRPGYFVARFGGEEFVIVLAETSVDGAAAMAEQLLRNVEGLGLQHAPNAIRPNITVSVGYATFEPKQDGDDNPDTLDLVKAADSALYQAKLAGRNCSVRGVVTAPSVGS